MITSKKMITISRLVEAWYVGLGIGRDHNDANREEACTQNSHRQLY